MSKKAFNIFCIICINIIFSCTIFTYVSIKDTRKIKAETAEINAKTAEINAETAELREKINTKLTNH